MKTEFEIPAPITQALANKGYETLTSVQEAVLDPALSARDLLVSSTFQAPMNVSPTH